MTLTVLDGYCGAGGSSSGAEMVPGVQVRYALNHWALAIATHNHNMPHVDHDRIDMTDDEEGDPRKYAATDIGWFSPECFPAGTVILTRRGLLPIEQVEVGDEVWTHRLRWRRVATRMSKVANTVTISGHGHSRLETTADHPFYVRTAGRQWDNGIRQYRRTFGQPEWVSAANLSPVPPMGRAGSGHFWGSPTEFGQTEIPPVRRRGMEFDGDFWWLVGRWLGDGCMRASRGEVQVTCGHAEADDLEKRLATVAGLRWTRRELRTATVFTASHVGLTNWLFQNFGEHAGGKTIPTWALAMRTDWREALLDGYVSADGGTYDRPEQRAITQCHTVSRRLAVGIRLLVQSLGWKASISVSDSRTEGVIEERRVAVRPLWRIHWCTDPSTVHDRTLVEGGIRWAPVRRVGAGHEAVEVFNLSIEEDESYTADGVIVHNCTTWSQARGEECDYDADSLQGDLFAEEAPEPDEAKQRSRFGMKVVPLFAAVHDYKAIIVENVTDILKWHELDRWLAELRTLGYLHRIVVLNSAFAHHLGAPAPQLRDRVYFVFWKARYRTPDFGKWTRPTAWCPTCERVVRAMFVDKQPGNRRAMRYAQQYAYRCPQVSCRNAVVHPYVLPAAAAIDWTLPAVRIGDRKDPLRPKTVARIEAGLRRYARPPVAPKGVSCPPMLVPSGGTWNDSATSVDEPMRTRTTRETEAVLVPPFLVPLRSGRPRTSETTEPLATVVANGSNHALVVPVGHPAPTFAAAGTHHALVMRNNTARGDQGQMSTPLHEPIRRLTTAGHQSLIRWDNHAVYGYDTGHLRPLGLPLPTQTTVQGDALLGRAVAVEDCTFRMLDVHEIKAGMAFAASFGMPVGAKRDKVRMLGNAVTPPAARDLIAAVVEAITGDVIEVTA